jgi:hypothetical protein
VRARAGAPVAPRLAIGAAALSARRRGPDDVWRGREGLDGHASSWLHGLWAADAVEALLGAAADAVQRCVRPEHRE